MVDEKGKPTSVAEYLEDLTKEERIVLQRMRRTIKKACPEAEEVISYGMPAFKYHGMLLWYAAHDKFFGMYVRPGNTKTLEKELAPWRSSKSTIRFTVEKPLPDALVVKIVKACMQANLAREDKNREKQQVAKRLKATRVRRS